MKLNEIKQELKLSGQSFHLTTKEFYLLDLLNQNFGKLVKREIILSKIWERTDEYAARSMDVYIVRLRKGHYIIKNVRKEGYILQEVINQ